MCTPDDSGAVFSDSVRSIVRLTAAALIDSVDGGEKRRPRRIVNV
jgi:hypothetical protein